MSTLNRCNLQNTTWRRYPTSTAVSCQTHRPLWRRAERKFSQKIPCVWILWRHHRWTAERLNGSSHNFMSKSKSYINEGSSDFKILPLGRSWKHKMSSRRGGSRTPRLMLPPWPWRQFNEDSTNGFLPSKDCTRHITCLHIVLVSLTHSGKAPSESDVCTTRGENISIGWYWLMVCTSLYNNVAHIRRMDLKWRTSRSFICSRLQDPFSLYPLIFSDAFEGPRM